MIGCHRKLIACLLILLGFLSACSALSPEPTTTPIPEPTDTPTPTVLPSPTLAPANLLMDGWTAFDTGDLDAAQEIAKQVRQQFPEDYHAYSLLVAIEAQQNDLSAYIEQLEIELDNGSQDLTTANLLSEAYLLQASQVKEDISTRYTYQEVFDLIYQGRDIMQRQQALGIGADPLGEALSTWFDLGIEYAGNGFNPGTPGYSYWLRATEHAHDQNYEAAIQEMELAIINDPTMENLYKITAEYYLYMGDYPKAIEYYLTVLGITPGLYEQWVDLANVYFYLHLPAQAHQALIGSMRSYPEFDYAEQAFLVYQLNFSPLDDTNFLDYGFRFALPPDGELTEAPEIVQNSAERGLVTFISDNMAVNLIWLPLSDFAFGPDYDPVEVLTETPEAFSELGDVTVLSEPLIFEYNVIPINYRAFLIGPNNMIDDTSLAAQAIWQCDSTVFVLQQIIAYDYTNTLYQFNPFFESITCGIDGIIPEHP